MRIIFWIVDLTMITACALASAGLWLGDLVGKLFITQFNNDAKKNKVCENPK